MKKNTNFRASRQKKIWIDLDNSPHVPFFRPIITELKKRDYPVVVTARDCFQVCDLADLLGLPYKKIGHHSGKNKVRKLVGLFYRALQMIPTVVKEKPAIALSHGSRAQLILTTMLQIPSIIFDDYEPSKGIPFMRPNWLLRPEVIPDDPNKTIKKRTIKYPGIKEDVYVPDFMPDLGIYNKLGIDMRNVTVTIRPPATEAHYHNPESDALFLAVVNLLGKKENTCAIILPRNERQGAWIIKQWPEWCTSGKIVIPNHVVDGLNLLWHSDLVISGGGTMNREAASLGVPVYSIFRGTIGAVDRYLARTGRLIFLENEEDIRIKVSLTKRALKEHTEKKDNATLNSIVTSILTILEN